MPHYRPRSTASTYFGGSCAMACSKAHAPLCEHAWAKMLPYCLEIMTCTIQCFLVYLWVRFMLGQLVH